MQQPFAHRQPLRRQNAMVITPPSPSPQTTGLQAQPAPPQGRPTPLRRQHAIQLFAPPPPPPPIQVTAPPLPQQSQPTTQPLQRQKTLTVTPQVPRRRCRFIARPLRREGALYGEADFRTPRPLMRTYAFYGEFPQNEHLPLLSARPLQRENAFYGESTLGLPLPAPTRRLEKKGVKFLRRPAGPSAKAAVLGQPKSILKKSSRVAAEASNLFDSPINARTVGRCFRTFSDVGDIQHWAATDRWVNVSKSQRTSLSCKGCGKRVVLKKHETYQRIQAWQQHKKRCWGIYNVEEQERKDLISRNNPLL